MSELTVTQLEAIDNRITTRPASEVESNWRSIVEETGEKDVVVTNDTRPEAVVISAERYAQLQAAARAHDQVHSLGPELDRELASLRTLDAGDKLRRVFAATPQEIADAANAAAAGDDE